MARYVVVALPEEIMSGIDADARGIVDNEPPVGTNRTLIARVASTHVGLVAAALNAYTPPA